MDSVEVTFIIPGWVITALIAYLLLGLALVPATAWFQTARISPKPAALNRLWPHGSVKAVVLAPLLFAFCWPIAYVVMHLEAKRSRRTTERFRAELSRKRMENQHA